VRVDLAAEPDVALGVTAVMDFPLRVAAVFWWVEAAWDFVVFRVAAVSARAALPPARSATSTAAAEA
jgi:hypothetical protein